MDVHWYKVHSIDPVQVTEMLFLDLQGKGRRGRFPPAFISCISVRYRRRHVAAAAAEEKKGSVVVFPSLFVVLPIPMLHACAYCTYIGRGGSGKQLTVEDTLSPCTVIH